jgi:hypothetical protein
VAKPVVEATEPVAELALVASPVASAAPPSKLSRQPAPTSAAPGTEAAPTTTTTAAAMRGGAEPSKDVDETGAGTSSGLGSSTVVRRDGGVEDGQRSGATAEPAVHEAPPVAVSPPVSAPPVIAAAPNASPALTGHTPSSVASTPTAARRLRYNAWRRGVSLPVPGAQRSLLPTARTDRVAARPRHSEPRDASGAQTPPPAAPVAPAASAGGALSGLSVPPPAAAYALLAATLAVMAVYFSALLAIPAHRRSVPFISLLERPG